MTLTINLPPELETTVRQQAARSGQDVQRKRDIVVFSQRNHDVPNPQSQPNPRHAVADLRS
jgi:hypothetical protein